MEIKETKRSGMIKGYIFDIQNYALYDGPGIRTSIFFKGCPLKCKWCHNPESQQLKPQLAYTHDKCVACGACVEACPNGALKLRAKRVSRDVEKCVKCGACVAACRTGAMERIGRKATVDDIVEAVKRDMPFYEMSGGGATITGGEPTMQAEFLEEALAELKSRNIHTAIETSGFFREDVLSRITRYTDLFLFDIKHPDPKKHLKYTGVPSDVIMKNFRTLLGKVGTDRVIVRVPLIPGVNTDEKSVASLCVLLKENGYKGEVHLMPYNSLAKTKWQKIGRGKEYKDYGPLEDSVIENIEAALRAAGFGVVVSK